MPIAQIAKSVIKPAVTTTLRALENFAAKKGISIPFLTTAGTAVPQKAQAEKLTSIQQLLAFLDPTNIGIRTAGRQDEAQLAAEFAARQTSQTPPQSASAVSPAALARTIEPSSVRVPGAVVPAAPFAPARVPAGPAIPPSVPIPSSPGAERARETFFGGAGFGTSPASSFGAAVPQAALLRILAQRPGRVAGHVGTPEALPLGAAPRRRVRREEEQPFKF